MASLFESGSDSSTRNSGQSSRSSPPKTPSLTLSIPCTPGSISRVSSRESTGRSTGVNGTPSTGRLAMSSRDSTNRTLNLAPLNHQHSQGSLVVESFNNSPALSRLTSADSSDHFRSPGSMSRSNTLPRLVENDPHCSNENSFDVTNENTKPEAICSRKSSSDSIDAMLFETTLFDHSDDAKYQQKDKNQLVHPSNTDSNYHDSANPKMNGLIYGSHNYKKLGAIGSKTGAGDDRYE